MYIQESNLSEYNRFVSLFQGFIAKYGDVPDLNLSSEIAKLDDISVRKWFDQLKIPSIFYETYNVTSRGLFGANIDEISALSFIPEIAFDYEDSKPVEAITDLENSEQQGKESTETFTFQTGITEVTDAIAKILENNILLNSKVTKITLEGSKYHILYTDSSGATQTVTADAVVLATPAPVTLSIASQILSEEQKSILELIPYAPYATVALYSQTPVFRKAFDLAVPDGTFFTDVYDSTWVQRYYDATLKDKADSIMSIYIGPGTYKDTSLLNLKDEDLLKKIYEWLNSIFPGVASQIVGYDIERFQYGYPVMTPGAYKRLSRLHRITNGSFVLAGDYMIYPTFEAAVETGFLAAEKATEALS